MRFRFSLKVFFIILFIFNISMAEAGVLEDNIKKHIKVLAQDFGERNYIQYQNLERCANYINEVLKAYGYDVREQVYSMENRSYRNIIVTKPGEGKFDKIIIVCAHYDSVLGSPGADDNASGIAGLLELARLLYPHNLNKTIKFIAFTNEEPPFYLTNNMGSFRFAKEAKRIGENIEAVLCLESMGVYYENKNSQNYPFGLSFFYPDRGNFIAVVSNLNSRHLLKRIVQEFKRKSSFPIEYLSCPVFLAPQISFSDHWSFWKFGYKAVMITDTAMFRSPHYHTQEDTPDKLNYQRLASLVNGLYNVMLRLSE